MLYKPVTSSFIYSLLLIIISLSTNNAIYSQKSKQVEILNSDQLIISKKFGSNIKRLIGNVELRHDSAYLFCDSAYFNTKENSFNAYGNVLMAQGDTLFLYGDSIYYEGNFSQGQVFNNVRLKDNSMTLKTNYLNFNMETNKSFYHGGGEIVDSINVLTSETGTYYSDLHEFYFKEDVILNNPDYTVFSDTLKYNTNTEVSYFLGPTEIISDSLYIYCENGWYDSVREISQYGKNTIIKKDENTIEADSLQYNRRTGIGIANNNITITDTIQKIVLKGNYSYFDQVEDYSFITDSAQFIQFEDNDTLFMHADTLFSSKDSTGKGKIIKAWNHVKIYRYELQGKCDSLSYSSLDSLIRLYGSPVLWNEKNQLTAEFIQIHNDNNKADRIDMNNKAFMISFEDTAKYNQISGKNMTAFIKNNEIFRIDVIGNAQSIYFVKDGEDITGINNSKASNIILHLKDGRIAKINLINSPEGVLNPPDKVKSEDTFIKGFEWLDKFRPKRKEDIFNWN